MVSLGNGVLGGLCARDGSVVGRVSAADASLSLSLSLSLGSSKRVRDGRPMEDMKKHRDVLLREAAECQLISDLATDKSKRELFSKLAKHHQTLAAALDRAIAE
jgi:hypothetical protein